MLRYALAFGFLLTVLALELTLAADTCPANYALPSCTDQYCRNNATFNCTCDFGYEGTQCEDTHKFCNHTKVMRNPSIPDIVRICGPHGHCSDGIPGALCTCDNGWHGDFCDIDDNGCQPNPCQNNGTCVNLVGPGYECICDKLHVGTNCENPRPFCKDERMFDETGQPTIVRICGDHGTCTDGPLGSYCTCDPGWTGTFCQHEIEYNCTSGGVQHQHGTKWNERCNTCTCEYGVTTCSKGYWCPDRCAIFETPKTVAHSLTVGCKPYENCIPDEVVCARENPACDFPIGWCFPVGVVMLEQISTPAWPSQ